MAIHWITFRIDERTVAGKTYQQRYQALVDAVNRHATDAWDEPTSFWLIKSESSRASIAASIKGAIATSVDLALVGGKEVDGATLVGTASKLAALKRMVPSLSSA
jgi:hypothetical protein